MSITVAMGQLTGGANDLYNAYNAWASGTPVLPPTGYAEPAFTAFGGILSLAGELTSGPLAGAVGTTAPLVAAVNLIGAFTQYQTARDSGDDAAIVSSILGVASNLGNFLATIPAPQTRAIGTLVNLAAGAAKAAWDQGWRPSLGPLPVDAHIPANFNPDLYNIPGMPSVIDPICNRDYTAARGWTFPRDPLVLDLDGDGIETVGINPLAPVLFDHDNDGVRTGTGWIQSDDGLLVIDVNGNGTIDSGRELFGDNSLLYTALDGPVYAADGYAALRAQDSNHDGVVNSLDANFNQLRVWRYLNQDGISQAGELQTLSQAGIASIGVTGTATNTNLGNGNTQVASGSFTRTNGTTGQSGTAELTWSYLLAGNNRRYLISSCSRNILLVYSPKKNMNSCTRSRKRMGGRRKQMVIQKSNDARCRLMLPQAGFNFMGWTI
jgi:hypothetical protein